MLKIFIKINIIILENAATKQKGNRISQHQKRRNYQLLDQKLLNLKNLIIYLQYLVKIKVGCSQI